MLVARLERLKIRFAKVLMVAEHAEDRRLRDRRGKNRDKPTVPAEEFDRFKLWLEKLSTTYGHFLDQAPWAVWRSASTGYKFALSKNQLANGSYSYYITTIYDPDWTPKGEEMTEKNLKRWISRSKNPRSSR